MDESKKGIVRSYLKYSQYTVLRHLNEVSRDLWEKNAVKKGSLFMALKNWLDVGFNEDLFKELPEHFIAQRLFEYTLDSEYST
jgi:hypothetical protein